MNANRKGLAIAPCLPLRFPSGRSFVSPACFAGLVRISFARRAGDLLTFFSPFFLSKEEIFREYKICMLTWISNSENRISQNGVLLLWKK